MGHDEDAHEEHPLNLPFDMSQLAAWLTPTGPVNLAAAKQIAHWTALHAPDGEGRVDAPTGNEPYLAVFEAAAAHIAALFDDPELRRVRLATLTRRDWADRQLEELLPALTFLSQVVSKGLSGAQVEADADELAQHGIDASMMQSILGSLAPTLVGTQAGGLLGTLSHAALGRYDIAMPAQKRDELWLVPGNLDAFATTWELDHDEAIFVVTAHELLHNILRGAPALHHQFESLIEAFTEGYAFDPERLAQSLFGGEDFDPGVNAVPNVDPMAFLAAMQTDAQIQPRTDLRRFVALTCGIVDTILRTAIRPLVKTFDIVEEARRRNRIECSSSSAFLEALLGVDLTREEYEAGDHFAQGVLDRAGFAGLSQIWTRDDGLPTKAEFDAPGLWLARLELST
ncbi:MAG: zinc-dependent metalloprotease [Acidimicrobiia bacterium]